MLLTRTGVILPAPGRLRQCTSPVRGTPLSLTHAAEGVSEPKGAPMPKATKARERGTSERSPEECRHRK
ncbi:hypothetical protein SCATT_44720 [Streptantibioticus cattleyicolor NRRL 8057 = DSM 46488]|uniref:Uncharacterized protein n=1 Tax=Streptantibioticus cattleyicolor (strain ATCC 35852 / DSM 46488 / JCM 4925 / NBRC 14057 / NRRL 8057) TaxID=1003195 RepID=G8WXL2_STREN|nr:hypothetical protein SCATT_44720 [Streptantibioticus cattleyicolor NRRL 8057 = DSM 46488]